MHVRCCDRPRAAGSEALDPKDRVETLIKTKSSSIHKRVAGNDTPAEARYRVEPTDVAAILAE